MNQQIIEAPRAGAAELITSKTALVALEKAALAELSVVDAGIAALRRKYRNKTYDVATSEGMDAARKARMDIRDRRFKVPHIVKDQKAAIKKVAEKVDSEGERIVAALLELETPIHDQIKGEEDRKAAIKAQKEREEAEAAARVETASADILAKPADVAGKSSEHIALAIEALDAVPVSLELYGDSAGRVDSVKAATLERLDGMLQAAQAHEKEQQELAAQRAALDAERQRQEEAARTQREQMEQQQREHDARMAEQRAALEKMQRETQAQADEIARKAAEQREQAERIERERQQRAEDIQRRIDAIRSSPETHADSSAAAISAALQALDDMVIVGDYYDDRTADAQAARATSRHALTVMFASATERERIQAEQAAAARRKADELAAQAAALDAKRKVAEQLFDAVTGLLDCEELAGEVSESTRALIKNAHDVIAQATTKTTA